MGRWRIGPGEGDARNTTGHESGTRDESDERRGPKPAR